MSEHSELVTWAKAQAEWHGATASLYQLGTESSREHGDLALRFAAIAAEHHNDGSGSLNNGAPYESFLRDVVIVGGCAAAGVLFGVWACLLILERGRWLIGGLLLVSAGTLGGFGVWLVLR